MKKSITLFAIFTLAFLSAVATRAQSTGPGIAQYGYYTKGTVDAVNNQNLNVRTEYMITAVAGRGFNFTFSESNDSLTGNPDWGWRTLLVCPQTLRTRSYDVSFLSE